MQWADYFDQHAIQYAFFSAANAAALQIARKEALASPSNTDECRSEPEDDGDSTQQSDSISSEDDADSDLYFSAEEDTPEGQDPRVKVLSVLELEDLFLKAAPSLSGKPACQAAPIFSKKYRLC